MERRKTHWAGRCPGASVLVVTALLLGGAVGCRTAGSAQPAPVVAAEPVPAPVLEAAKAAPEPVPTTTRVAVPPATAPTAPAPEAARPQPPAPAAPVALPAVSRAAEERASLRVSVAAEGQGDAEPVAAALRTHVAERVAAAGFQVSPGDPDVTVRLATAVELFDRAGEHEIYTGRVVMEAVRVCDGRVVDTTALTARGERRLGRTAALEALAAALQDKAASWAAAAITPEKTGLASMTLRVRRSGGDKADDGAYASAFARQVARVPGIVACVLENADYAGRKLTYRITYFRDRLPEGVAARLCTEASLGVRPDEAL